MRYMTWGLFCVLMLSVAFFFSGSAEPTRILPTDDFLIDGSGSSAAWEKAEWIHLTKRNDVGHDGSTRCKLLYSPKGLYILFDCQDEKITSTIREDFGEIFREDIVDIFIWPDQGSTIYFEYGISPHNFELALLVPNYDGFFHGWQPWRYAGERKTRHQTKINSEHGKVVGWQAEFFIPFALLKPLQNVPPVAGSRWRINLYRADFDSGKRAIWSWKPFHRRFHDYQQFGSVQFVEE
ncbi:MAG: carbohydrate-binding family 9-like protein [Verrucomicrobiota bacterium]